MMRNLHQNHQGSEEVAASWQQDRLQLEHTFRQAEWFAETLLLSATEATHPYHREREIPSFYKEYRVTGNDVLITILKITQVFMKNQQGHSLSKKQQLQQMKVSFPTSK